jgi:hypothetical protein
MNEEQAQIALAICQSEPFAWLMAGSNHVDMQLAALRPAWEQYVEAGGGYFNRSKRQ